MKDNYLVYQLLEDAATKWPDRPAIHDMHGTLTFGELLLEVQRLKAELEQRGIRPGMGVGVMARNSRNFIVAVFAVLGNGAAVMPVSHQLKQPELEEIVETAKLNATLDDASGIDPTEGKGERIDMNTNHLRFAYTHIARDHRFAAHVEAPAFIRFTSGTTGTSKGVIIGNRSVLERTAAANKGLHLNHKSNVVWVLPMAYHFVVSIVLYIRSGAAITIVPDFMPRSVIEMTNKFQGTMLYASPLQIRMLAADTSNVGMDSLQLIISTSAGINTEVSSAFKKRFNKSVQQAFGIIEIGLPIINPEVGDEFQDAVGYALPDYDVKVFDDAKRPVGAGEKGLLGIKGPGMFDAYLDPPTKREELLEDGYFFTADYASISETGMIRIEGRKKSLINIAGNKVFAEEVEHVLETLDYIEQARVSGIPHPLMGQIIQAEVVLKGTDAIDVEKTLTYCRERLSTFKIPQKLVVVDRLEMTNTGKIKR